MANHKLVLDDDLEESFFLIAIHCSEEAYKMAYLLNKYVALHLTRETVDVDFTVDGLEANFPLFKFYNSANDSVYYLVANKFTSVIAHTASSGGLFGDASQEETTAVYLLPEYKKVDFFLKISSDNPPGKLRTITMAINTIKQVISAYGITSENIKNKNNLIFD